VRYQIFYITLHYKTTLDYSLPPLKASSTLATIDVIFGDYTLCFKKVHPYDLHDNNMK